THTHIHTHTHTHTLTLTLTLTHLFNVLCSYSLFTFAMSGFTKLKYLSHMLRKSIHTRIWTHTHTHTHRATHTHTHTHVYTHSHTHRAHRLASCLHRHCSFGELKEWINKAGFTCKFRT